MKMLTEHAHALRRVADLYGGSDMGFDASESVDVIRAAAEAIEQTIKTRSDKLNALTDYLVHHSNCSKRRDRLQFKPDEQCVCDCGLDKAFKAFNEALKP